MGSQIVGLVPLQAILDVAEYYILHELFIGVKSGSCGIPDCGAGAVTSHTRCGRVLHEERKPLYTGGGPKNSDW